MSKLTRKQFKRFGGSAVLADVDQYGSVAAGGAVTSLDPATIQALGAWATGWATAVNANKSPVLQDMNAVDFVFAYMLFCILEEGVPDWETNTTYWIGSIVNSSGILYTSIVDSNLGNAVTDATKWTPYGRRNKNSFASPLSVGAAAIDIGGVSEDVAMYVTGDAVVATQSAPSSKLWFAIAWSKDLHIFTALSLGGGTAGYGMSSPDGKTWTARNMAANKGYNDIVWSSPLKLFIAVADATSAITNCAAYSADGKNWTAVNTAEANPYVQLAASDTFPMVVSVPQSGGATDKAMYSVDGIAWTATALPAGNVWRSVCWSSELGLFVATGTNCIATSLDGITWTSRTSPSNNDWYGVSWSKELGLFCAVGAASTKCMTSPDGITWTASTASLTFNVGGYRCLTWSPEFGQFVCILSSGASRIITSPDGVNWQAFSIAEANTMVALVYAPALLRFVSISTDGTHQVQTLDATTIATSPQITVGAVNGQRLKLIGGKGLSVPYVNQGGGMRPFTVGKNQVVGLIWDSARSVWVKE